MARCKKRSREAWGRSGCVESEIAEASVEVQFRFGGLPGDANRLGVDWAAGLVDVAQGAEECRGYTDSGVDVVVGETVPKRSEGVRQEGAEPVVEVLPQGRSGFVEGGYEVGVAVSPTVDRFVGDVDDLGGLCVDRAGEQRLGRLLLPWGDGQRRRRVFVGLLVCGPAA